MSWIELLALAGALLAVAVLYSSVGHGGASGYLMVMGVWGLAPDVMKPTALILNLFVASLAVVRFGRAGGFHWRTLWPFVVTSLPCAFLGGAARLDPDVYRKLVGVVLLLAAVRLVLRMPARTGPEPATVVPVWAGALWGAAIGLLSGMVGVGGGIFLSPVLLIAGWATARRMAGVSAAFILINSASGLAGFIARQGAPPLEAGATAAFIAAVALGGLVGTWIGTRRLGHIGLRRAIAVVLVIAGLKMLFLSETQSDMTHRGESATLPG